MNFLKELKDNNNREWFENNKNHYLELKSFIEQTAQTLIAGISSFDPSAALLTTRDCTYRIYRDTRFSADKTPYKRHMGIFINPPYGKKSIRMGYYLHLQPGECSIGVGNIGLPPKLIQDIRTAIKDNIDEYLQIIEQPNFKSLFPKIGENLVKTAPKGFSKDWEYINLVRPRDFYVSHSLTDKEVKAKNFISKALEIFKTGKPFADFINYSVDEYLGEFNHEY